MAAHLPPSTLQTLLRLACELAPRTVAAANRACAALSDLAIRGNHIAQSTPSDVVDRSEVLLPGLLAFQLLVEAEDGSLGAVVHVAGAASAALEGLGLVGGGGRGEAGEGCWAGGGCCGGGGCGEARDVASAATAAVHSVCFWDGGVRLEDLEGRHAVCLVVMSKVGRLVGLV